jgi:hypothetical protein
MFDNRQRSLNNFFSPDFGALSASHEIPPDNLSLQFPIIGCLYVAVCRSRLSPGNKLRDGNDLHGTSVSRLTDAVCQIFPDFSFTAIPLDLIFTNNLAFRIIGIGFEDFRATSPTGSTTNTTIPVDRYFYHLFCLLLL